MNIALAIPARYGSSRFPGKPLAKIAGKTMLSYVVENALKAADAFSGLSYISISVFVTTEDERIAAHCRALNVACILTPESCKTGSDRVLAALRQMNEWPEFVINLQGDAPFTPPEIIIKIIEEYIGNPDLKVVTPVYQLSWDKLDALREAKKTTPFSGTSVIINSDQKAIWFSKTIIPALRLEDRASSESPIYQHLGLYGFRTDILEKFCGLPQSTYEKIEGLEQLRLLENGIEIQTLVVDSDALSSGIDTPEDLARAEILIKSRA